MEDAARSGKQMTVKTYRLWDTDVNRLFGTFDDEAAALELVRTLLNRYGEAYAEDLALGGEQRDGSFGPPLTGAALVARTKQLPIGLGKPDLQSLRAGTSPDDEMLRTEQRKAG
jgi:hypothetical protein